MKLLDKLTTSKETNLGSEPVGRLLATLAVPAIASQIVNALYNMVDRMYIGHIPETGPMALTGLGVCFPLIMIVSAVACLVGMGGAPKASIYMGRRDNAHAEKILGNCTTALIFLSVTLTILVLLFKRPLLYLFGASENTIEYAESYMTIYALGTVFVQLTLGLNSFISAQGFSKISMFTVIIGAVTNIILDPVFIFGFGMGVKGAALATVISQGASALWVFHFLTGKKALLRLKRRSVRLRGSLVKEITLLGTSGFVMSVTNGLVQIVCNAVLSRSGGDLYVGIITVINSVREIINMPLTGLTSGAQPVIGYNYGAKCYDRVKSAVRFMTVWSIVFSLAVWAVIFFEPRFFMHLFTQESELIREGIPAMRIYFCGIFMMALQFAGQSTYVALNRPKQAVFFSLLRKVIIVVPLTILLPMLGGLGTDGVFLAEPVSNVIGGTACFATMLVTVWPALKDGREDAPS